MGARWGWEARLLLLPLLQGHNGPVQLLVALALLLQAPLLVPLLQLQVALS